MMAVEHQWLVEEGSQNAKLQCGVDMDSGQYRKSIAEELQGIPSGERPDRHKWPRCRAWLACRQRFEPLPKKGADCGRGISAMRRSHDPRDVDACAPLESLDPVNSSSDQANALGDRLNSA
jgi:hypothetical protein